MSKVSFAQPIGGTIVLNVIHEGKEVVFHQKKQVRDKIKSIKKDFVLVDYSEAPPYLEIERSSDYLIKNTVSTIVNYHLQIIHIPKADTMDIYFFYPESMNSYLEIPFKDGKYFLTIPRINRGPKELKEILDDATNNVFYELPLSNGGFRRLTNITPIDWEKHRLNAADSPSTIDHLDYVISRDYEGSKSKITQKAFYADSTESYQAQLSIDEDEAKLTIKYQSALTTTFIYKEFFGKLTLYGDSTYHIDSLTHFAVYVEFTEGGMDDMERIQFVEPVLNISPCAKDLSMIAYVADRLHPEIILKSIEINKLDFLEKGVVKSIKVSDIYSNLGLPYEEGPGSKGIYLRMDHMDGLTAAPIVIPYWPHLSLNIHCSAERSPVIVFGGNQVLISDEIPIVLKKH